MLEWNAPPLRFRHLGTTSFYASNARLSVFAAGLSLDPELDERRRRIGDFGTQIDVRMWLLSRLQLTLSVGGAVAVEEGFGQRREWMASPKILH